MATFKLNDAASIREKTGIGQKQAKRVLESALTKITIEDGKYVGNYLTELEHKVCSAYSGMMIFQPAYSEEQLITEFASCLQKNGLLSDEDVPAVLAASQYIAVYAIERMHLCNLLIEEHPPCLLSAGVLDAREGGFLTVGFSINIRFGDKSVNMGSSIFTTTCLPSDWVDETLWEEGMKGYWTVPIELGASGKLTEAV